MNQEYISLIIAIGGVITSILIFIWRLSNKYHTIEHTIAVIKTDVEGAKKQIETNSTSINTQENKLNTVSTNIANMSSVMVFKSDLTRLETEMLHLKDNIDDIKLTLRDSIKLTTTQYQELSQKLGLIIGQYNEIKEYVKK